MGRFQRLFFSFLPVLVILLSRIPSIATRAELNVDESQMLAQAMRYQLDFMPWRAVDGTSSGPLNSWALLLGPWLGFELSYTWAHLLAALLLGGSVWLLCSAAARTFGFHAGVLSAAVAAVWLALNQGADFVHYASELVPLVLISAAIACPLSVGGNVAAAVMLGLVPWAKLQAAPIAFLAGVWLVYRSFGDPALSAGQRYGRSLGLVAAALLPTLVMLGTLAQGGVIGDMWQSYLVANLQYAGEFRLLPLLGRTGKLFLAQPAAPWLLLLGLGGAIALAGRRASDAAPDPRHSARWAFALLIVSVFAVVRSELALYHYNLLLLPGLILTSGCVLQRLLAAAGNPRLVALALAAAGATYLGSTLAGAYRENFVRHSAESGWAASWAETARLGKEITAEAGPGESLAVWGWYPALHVVTGMPPATRHAIGHFLFLASPARDLLRRSYLSDLAASRCRIFVDAGERSVGPGWGEGSTLRRFPELRTFVEDHFRLARTVPTRDGPVSIYLRRTALDGNR